jgi:Mn2+/Fe2+ NRAMP family transporter
VRDRFGFRMTIVALSALVIANLGTLCAEFAGIAARADLLFGVAGT